MLAESNEIRLTLDQVKELTLKNNSRIKLALLDYEIAKVELEAAQVDFDLHLLLSPFYKKTTKLSDLSYLSFLSQEHSFGSSIGLKRKFNLGTQLEWSLQQIKSFSDSPDATFESWYQVGSKFKVTQPLLKGWGKAFNEVRERKEILKVEKYKWALKETLEQQIFESFKFFWDLYLTYQLKDLKEKELEWTQNNYESERARFELGKKSNVDLLFSIAQLESVKAKLILLETDLKNQSQALAREIGSTGVIIPIVSEAVTQKENQARAPHLEENPKLNKLKFEILDAEVDLEKAANQKQPQLDLSFEFLSTGLNISYGRAFGSLLKFTTPAWEVALLLHYPIGENAAEGEYLRVQSVIAQKTTQQAMEKENMRMVFQKAKNNLEKQEKILSHLMGRLSQNLEKKKSKDFMYLLGKISIRELFEGFQETVVIKQQELEAFVELQKEKLNLKKLAGALSS